MLVLLAAIPALSGCSGVADVTPEAVGLGAGAGAGVVTANPLIGLAVGLGTRLITAEAISYVQNEQQYRIQRAIAQAAGNSTETQPIAWSTPPDDFFDSVLGAGHGHLQVIRDLGTRIRCREILYDVASDDDLIEAAVQSVETDVAGTASESGDAVPDEADPWPRAGADPVKAAMVCYGALGWQWAVSEPAVRPPL